MCHIGFSEAFPNKSGRQVLEDIPCLLRRRRPYSIDKTWMEDFRMIRVFSVSIALFALSGLAYAQAPAQARPAPPRVVIGPPAPVPPEVAMLRPSVTEVAKIN